MTDRVPDDILTDEAGGPFQKLESAPPAPPLRDRIRELAIRRASGDLTCAAVHAGVRAHLQAGRLAWAYDTTHPRAFAARLCELARLDPAMVDALAKECIRSHQPLGETLIARRLATLAQVRTAVRSQVELAFLGCHWCASCRAGFRDDAAGPVYDTGLTFSVEELASGPAEQPEGPCSAEEEEPSPIDWNLLIQGLGEPRDCSDLDASGVPAAVLPEAARRAVSEVLGEADAGPPAEPLTAEERERQRAARLEAWLASRTRH